MEKHPVECVMDTTLLHIKEMADVDTVVGKPVFSENGTIIIPLSKLGIGFVSGGAASGQKNAPAHLPSAGGGGDGMSVSPCGFLVINNGAASFLSAQPNDSLDKVLNNIPQIIREVKTALNDMNIFGDGQEDEEDFI